jgi:hypothetical protein
MPSLSCGDRSRGQRQAACLPRARASSTDRIVARSAVTIPARHHLGSRAQQAFCLYLAASLAGNQQGHAVLWSPHQADVVPLLQPGNVMPTTPSSLKHLSIVPTIVKVKTLNSCQRRSRRRYNSCFSFISYLSYTHVLIHDLSLYQCLRRAFAAGLLIYLSLVIAKITRYPTWVVFCWCIGVPCCLRVVCLCLWAVPSSQLGSDVLDHCDREFASPWP